MRFIGASVFVRAFIKPMRELKSHEERIKRRTKQIVKGIDTDEEIAIGTVHLAGVANILEDFMPLKSALEIVGSIISKPNITIIDVTGKMLEHMDILTAAIALRYCATLVTRNIRHFSRIQKLRIKSL